MDGAGRRLWVRASPGSPRHEPRAKSIRGWCPSLGIELRSQLEICLELEKESLKIYSGLSTRPAKPLHCEEMGLFRAAGAASSIWCFLVFLGGRWLFVKGFALSRGS